LAGHVVLEGFRCVPGKRAAWPPEQLHVTADTVHRAAVGIELIHAVRGAGYRVPDRRKVHQRVDQGPETDLPGHRERDIDAVEDRSIVLGYGGIRQVHGDDGVLRNVLADDGGRGQPVQGVHGRGCVRMPAAGHTGQRGAVMDSVDGQR